MGGSILVLRFTWAPLDMPLMLGLHMDTLYYYSAEPYNVAFLSKAAAHIVEQYLAGEPPGSIDWPGVMLKAVSFLGAVTEGFTDPNREDKGFTCLADGDPAYALSTVGLVLTNGFPAHTVSVGVGVAGRGRFAVAGIRYLEAVFRDPANVHVVKMHRFPGKDKAVLMEISSPDYEEELRAAFGRLEHLFRLLP